MKKQVIEMQSHFTKMRTTCPSKTWTIGSHPPNKTFVCFVCELLPAFTKMFLVIADFFVSICKHNSLGCAAWIVPSTNRERKKAGGDSYELHEKLGFRCGFLEEERISSVNSLSLPASRESVLSPWVQLSLRFLPFLTSLKQWQPKHLIWGVLCYKTLSWLA